MEIPQDILDKTKDFTGREWVFERINTWLGNKMPQHFLLTGGPGTGKSAISARLIQICRGEAPADSYEYIKKTKLVYSHFCQAPSDPTIDSRSFVLDLHKHLVELYPGLLNTLQQGQKTTIEIRATVDVQTVAEGASIYGNHINNLNIGIESAREAYQYLIRKPLEDLCTDEFHDTLLIIVDGLDESLSRPAETSLVTLLKHGRDLPPHIRFLLISRPDKRVLFSLGDPNLDLTINPPSGLDEIGIYASKRLELATGIDRDRICRQISKKSEGNFLYARYIIDDFLRKIANNEDLEAFTFPDGLEGYYANYLEYTLAKDLSQWEDLFRPILGLFAVAKGEGLTRDQIVSISKLDNREIDMLLRSLLQYLKGPEPDGPFQIFHHSFREFLLNNLKFDVKAERANEAIADHFFDIYGKDWRSCKDTYALRYTPDHHAEAIKSNTKNPQRQTRLQDHLVTILADYRFIETKLRISGLTDLLDDYDTLPENGDLRLIQEALQLSAHVLIRDLSQLPSQIYGRLMDLDSPTIRNLCTEIIKFTEYQWLRPLRPSLTPPGTALKRILTTNTLLGGAVAISPDGERVAAGSEDGSIILFDLASNTHEEFPAHDNEIYAVTFSPDGRFVVSGSEDTTLRVWDITTRTSRELIGYDGVILGIAISPDGKTVMSWSDEGILRICDLATNDICKELFGNTELIVTATFSGDGKTLALGGDENTFWVWNLASGTSHELIGQTDSVTAAAISLDGETVVLGLDDGSLRICDLVSNTSREISGDTVSVTAVAISPDGRTAVSGSESTLRIWDLVSGTSKEISGGSITAVAISPDGRTVVSGSYDGTLRIWDLTSRTSKKFLELKDPLQAVAISQNGKVAVSASVHYTLLVRDFDSGSSKELIGHEGVREVAISADGNIVVSGSEDGTLRVWNLVTKTSRNLIRCNYAVDSVAISPDGRIVVYSSRDIIRVWDLYTDKSKELPGDFFNHIAISHDGRIIIFDSGGFIWVWNLTTDTSKELISGDTASVTAVAISPDGRIAISGSLDYTLRVWDLTTDTSKELIKHNGHIRALAISQDGRIAVSGSDNTIRVWDLKSGNQITLFSLEETVFSCTILTDGKIVAWDPWGNVHNLQLEVGNK